MSEDVSIHSPIPPLRPRIVPPLDVAVGAIPGALLHAAPAIATAIAAALGLGGLASGASRARALAAAACFFASFGAIGAAAGATRDFVAGRRTRPARWLLHAWREGTRLLVAVVGGLFALATLEGLYVWLFVASESETFRLHLLLGGQVVALCGTAALVAVPAVVGVCERRRGVAAFGQSFGYAFGDPSRYAGILVFMVCGWLFWMSFPPLSFQPKELGHPMGALRAAGNAAVLGVLLVAGLTYTLARHYPRTAEEDSAAEAEESALLRAHRGRRIAFVVLLALFWLLLNRWLASPTDLLL